MGGRLHGRVQWNTSSPTGIGSRRRRVLSNLECPVGLSQKRNVRISMKEIWRILDGPPKNKEL